jgi:hypothetical protein
MYFCLQSACPQPTTRFTRRVKCREGHSRFRIRNHNAIICRAGNTSDGVWVWNLVTVKEEWLNIVTESRVLRFCVREVTPFISRSGDRYFYWGSSRFYSVLLGTCWDVTLKLKNVSFLDVAPCVFIINECFEVTCLFHLQVRRNNARGKVLDGGNRLATIRSTLKALLPWR